MGKIVSFGVILNSAGFSQSDYFFINSSNADLIDRFECLINDYRAEIDRRNDFWLSFKRYGSALDLRTVNNVFAISTFSKYSVVIIDDNDERFKMFIDAAEKFFGTFDDEDYKDFWGIPER